MKTLDRKLLRDLANMKSQAITIALVMAAGIGAFVAQLSTYTSLQATRQSYYEDARFSQVFADVKRAPKAVEQQIVELAGVAEVETTVMFDVTLDIPEVAEPVIGRMIGLSNSNQPQMNRLTLRQGRFIERGEANEALVSEGFAKARRLKPGDRLAAILNGKREMLTIVGIVLSPEYIFATRGGALPDDRSFGVFWMDRERLASAFNMEGAFNHAVLRMAPGASEPALIDALDRLLEPYGARGAHGRDDQLSHKILSQEINQQKTMSTVFPSIFLGVAAFLLNVVLSRQVATQRSEIAALKAVGYTDAAIAIHYLKMILVIVLLGIVMGFMIGVWLGYFMTNMYTDFFHFPKLAYRVQPWIPLTAAAVSAFAAFGGAFNTLRGIMRLPPAEAMRPPSPTQYRRMLLERIGMERLLSPQARMIARTLERRPFRAALTAFGIACSVAVIVSGTFWQDAIDYLISVQFNAADRGDIQVVFAEPVADSARYEIAHLPGVLFTENSRAVPVRLRAGHRSYLTSVSGLPDDSRLRRLLDEQQRQIYLPPEGVLITDRLADRLGVKPGDIIQLEILEGNRVKRDLPLAGVVNDLFGLTVYMDIRALNRLMAEGDSISSVNIASGGDPDKALLARLKEMPKVATVSIKASALQTFNETSARNMLVFTAIVTIFAIAIAVGVVYNSARIALAERAWELASLRVLGFTRHEVSSLLLGELAIELLVAIPLGLWLGYLLSVLIISFTHTETFSIPVIIQPRTYAYAALATLLAGVVSALIVRHRIDHLDLVAVLKTRE
jgi:putative ABC transport system permease protein